MFLEKPPGATVSEVEALIALARRQGVTLYASWHSRHAAAVAQAKAWSAERKVERIDIQWREDVRHWHPGQPWIWEAGGFGVFDPGINALSILTEIVGEPITVLSAELEVPSNKQAPIGATLSLATASGEAIDTIPTMPASSTLIWAPVSAWIVLIILPLGPITSPIFSTGISKLEIFGAFSPTSGRGPSIAPAFTSRMANRASRAWLRAPASTSAGIPSLFVSSCRAVTSSEVPAA